jgi:hypothetical protein
VEFLAIDHENGGGKRHMKQIGGGGAMLARWLRDNKFPLGYRVACHNCNQSAGLYGCCPHKGQTSFWNSFGPGHTR